MDQLPIEIMDQIKQFLPPWKSGIPHPLAKLVKADLDPKGLIINGKKVKRLSFCIADFCYDCGELRPEPESCCACDYQCSYLNYSKNNWYVPDDEFEEIMNIYGNHPYFDYMYCMPPYLMNDEADSLEMSYLSSYIYQKMRKSIWKNGRPKKRKFKYLFHV